MDKLRNIINRQGFMKIGSIFAIFAILLTSFLFTTNAYAALSKDVDIKHIQLGCGVGNRTFTGTANYLGASQDHLVVKLDGVTKIHSHTEPSNWQFTANVAPGNHTIEAWIYNAPNTNNNNHSASHSDIDAHEKWNFHVSNCNVTICHATGSNNNPFNKITVDDDAVDGDGNSDHNRSGHQNGQDIIPPGPWDTNGRNWNATGQAIWNNNCNVPTTPTTAPTTQPTAEPTTAPTTGPTSGPTTTPTEEDCTLLGGENTWEEDWYKDPDQESFGADAGAGYTIDKVCVSYLEHRESSKQHAFTEDGWISVEEGLTFNFWSLFGFVGQANAQEAGNCVGISGIGTQTATALQGNSCSLVSVSFHRALAPTATPTPTAPPSPHGDGLSDGRCSGCTTPAPTGQVLSSAAAGGDPYKGVLGASTMANTGTFEDVVLNVFAVLGALLVAAGYFSYTKEKKT